MCTNASELINSAGSSPVGLHKAWPTLVHVHIATEDLEVGRKACVSLLRFGW